ncbi:hypothetical protein PVL29_004618 [Vitis rotundifolia]|uniref:LRAT domain-containing protein n=1 Tax=Vitis rotundifolia TaxID=103349 RepID=A0AA39A8H0_VITRO|nr:hypothetical protein PVL29_004618 [Vitis rotundifolia]
MGVLSDKISREQLKPGDHIYSWRTAHIYAHHGIYTGEGMVIHFTRAAGQEIGTGTELDRAFFVSVPSHSSDAPCPRCGYHLRLRGGVISTCLDCFLADGDLYLFRYDVSLAFFIAKFRGGTCTLAASDPPADVIHRASFLLQHGFGVYQIFKNNCEDFAVYCKTGLLVFTNTSVGLSGQAVALFAIASAIISSPLRFLTTGFTGLAVIGWAMFSVSRLVSDVAVRRDVIKVSVERLVAYSGLDEQGITNTTKEDSITEMAMED